MPPDEQDQHDFSDGEGARLWSMIQPANSLPDRPCRAPLGALTIASFLDRRMTEAGREAVESHLACCAECRAEVRHAASLVHAAAQESAPIVHAELLQRLRGVMPPHSSEDPFPLRRIYSAHTLRGRRDSIPFVFARWGLATAASIAVCAIGWRVGSGVGMVESSAGTSSIQSQMSFGILDETEDDDDGAAFVALLMTESAS